MEPSKGAQSDGWDFAHDGVGIPGMTDGLPVIPPTEERVRLMLATAAVDPAASLGILPPAYADLTWRDIAVNAVMAGCAPSYLRVLGAALQAVSAPEFNLLGIATTTGSACVCLIVNGPVVHEIGMNAGCNAFGPGNRANATIGRALQLSVCNIGGARPGEIDMATLGQPGKYTFCFAENEAQSPWPPLQVERGLDRNTSAVTAVGVSGSVEIVDGESRTPEDLAQTFAQSMLIAGTVGSGGLLGGGEPLIVMPPEHADVFSRAGYSKTQTKQAIWERALLPLERLAAPLRERARATGCAAEGNLRVAQRPEDVMIVVAGGVGRKAAYLPTWSGGTLAVSRAV